jgi:hypothetical protein
LRILAALLVALMFTTQIAGAERGLDETDVVTYIYHWSYVYGVDPGDMLRLAMCESGQQPYGRDGSAGEVGPMQWSPAGLWRSTPDAHLGFQSFRDPERNVRMTAWAIAHHYENHWSCWRVRHKYAPF